MPVTPETNGRIPTLEEKAVTAQESIAAIQKDVGELKQVVVGDLSGDHPGLHVTLADIRRDVADLKKTQQDYRGVALYIVTWFASLLTTLVVLWMSKGGG
jgi:hypothetical protein